MQINVETKTVGEIRRLLEGCANYQPRRLVIDDQAPIGLVFITREEVRMNPSSYRKFSEANDVEYWPRPTPSN